MSTNHDAIDVGRQQIAAVYAKAFLGAAESSGDLTGQIAELDSLIDDVLEPNPELERMLGTLFIKHEKKLQMIDRVFANRASGMFLVFLKVLSKHGRLDCLRAIRRKVQSLYNEMQGRVEVTLSTPTAIDEPLREEIARKLRGMLGAEPDLHVVTDPDLLGGAVVRVGDTVYDGSVATRLARLRTQMIDRTVEQIETSRDRFE